MHYVRGLCARITAPIGKDRGLRTEETQARTLVLSPSYHVRGPEGVSSSIHPPSPLYRYPNLETANRNVVVMSFLALPDKPFRTGTGTGKGSSSESSLGLGGRSGRLDLKDDAIMDQDQEPASSYSPVASSSKSPPTARTRHVASPFMPRKDRMKDVEKDIRICSLAELRVMLEKKEGLLNDS